MFCDAHEEYLVPGIEEDTILTSEPEDKMPLPIIPDEGESMRSNENPKSTEFTYHKKGAKTNTSAYNRVLNSLNKLYSSYNLTITRMNVIKGNYNVNGDIRVILIVEQE